MLIDRNVFGPLVFSVIAGFLEDIMASKPKAQKLRPTTLEVTSHDVVRLVVFGPAKLSAARLHGREVP